MARHFHKQIDLRIQGGETTLDKKIIEKLGNPLIHILRNCIDHGIETPQERLKQGKPATGRISIQARQHSGHVEILVIDDGRGIQIEKLRQRLITKGLFSEEQMLNMADAEVINTVFLPSTSTSDIITDISGRGFGMDIVKTEIERLKGSVTLTSQPGEGTQCLFSLPVTLTTVRCLMIAVCGHQFAVPIDSIEETLHISPQECIRVVDHDAVRLRNQMVYVVPLAELLQLPHISEQEPDKLFILIAHSTGKRVGLIVDDILDEQDIVVKQLPAHMRSLKTLAGATISGENTVVLILHIPEIVTLVSQATGRRDAAGTAAGSAKPARILLVEDSVSTAEIEKLILESQGYCVDVAPDGLAALRELENAFYDAIVTDIEMPGMDGFSLTERIRQMSVYEQVPIIIVTSLERDSDKQRGIQVGADAYITKGDFEQSRLVETIKSLL
jgi:two-component system, chemotaxis family, sensor kinase CheA